jgi:hypothetical protein
MSTVVIVIIAIAAVALLGLLLMSLSGRIRRPPRPAAIAPSGGSPAPEPRSHAEAARREGRG